MTEPIPKEQVSDKSLSFLGQLTIERSDELLQKAYKLITNNEELYDRIRAKEIFSCVVELIQNIAEYNKEKSSGDIPESSVSIQLNAEQALIKTSNWILKEDIPDIKQKFNDLFNLEPETLQLKYKNALLQGNSLGLYMLKKTRHCNFNWKLEIGENEQAILHLEMILYYGAITN